MNDTKTVEPKKTCFVIMPISDVEGYEKGHFGLVYDHLIKPACEASGFVALRADDATKTNYIVIDVLRSILDAPIAVCDLSARSPNVMYELGVRQAFNKPVVLLKDQRTEKIFDIQGLRYTEYDESLRVDTVARDAERLSAFLKNTSTAQDVNSVIQLLGVKPAEVSQGIQLSKETSVLLSAVEDIGRRLRVIERGMGRPHDSNLFTEVMLPDTTRVGIGEMIYKLPGEEVGTLVEIERDAIYVKTAEGNIEKIPKTSSRFAPLTTIPF